MTKQNTENLENSKTNIYSYITKNYTRNLCENEKTRKYIHQFVSSANPVFFIKYRMHISSLLNIVHVHTTIDVLQ